MFKTMKQLFTHNNKDLRHRIYFTLAALVIFILGISIRVPGTENLGTNLGFLELLNTMGGGALKNFSIFALGVMPYITASIIMQLLQMDVIPYFTELSKQGHSGRQKLNQITRYIGILFAFIEGYAFAFAFIGKSGDPMQYLYIATVLTAGTSFLLWLGDQITQKGIGNGTSLISVPGIIAQVVKNEKFSMFVSKYFSYNTPVGFIIYVILIFLFAYFYTFIQLKPEEFSKNLQENGGFIPGVRPGTDTKKYLNRVLSRLTVLGAVFLVIIAGIPILFSNFTSMPTSVSIGGTGLLIVVGVALETYKQLEGSLLARNYRRGYSRR